MPTPAETPSVGDQAAWLRAYPIALRASKVWSSTAVASGKLRRHDKPDLEQAALVRAWQAMALYRPERGALSPYVDRVVRNASLSALRAERSWQRGSTASVHKDVSAPTLPLDLRIDVRTAIALLSDGERAVAIGLMADSATDVGRRLGIRRSTVYRRIGAIRKHFESLGLGVVR